MYSPLDLTLLDHHLGNISAWRDAITEIHSRGMYVIMDNTFATLGDLIGFEGTYQSILLELWLITTPRRDLVVFLFHIFSTMFLNNDERYLTKFCRLSQY